MWCLGLWDQSTVSIIATKQPQLVGSDSCARLVPYSWPLISAEKEAFDDLEFESSEYDAHSSVNSFSQSANSKTAHPVSWYKGKKGRCLINDEPELFLSKRWTTQHDCQCKQGIRPTRMAVHHVQNISAWLPSNKFPDECCWHWNPQTTACSPKTLSLCCRRSKLREEDSSS